MIVFKKYTHWIAVVVLVAVVVSVAVVVAVVVVGRLFSKIYSLGSGSRSGSGRRFGSGSRSIRQITPLKIIKTDHAIIKKMIKSDPIKWQSSLRQISPL